MNPDAKRANSFLRQLTAVIEARINKIAYRRHLSLVALLAISAPGLAQTAPNLGSLAPFGIVSSTFTNTSAATSITGNVCFTTGPAVTPLTVTGTYGACPVAAGPDQLAALATINGQTCTALPPGPLEGISINAGVPGTFPPGCYVRAGALDISVNGVVTLNGVGVYIFRSSAGALTTGANSRVMLTGGACPGNVFWAPVGATTLGAASTFVGTILDAAGITLGLNANLSGRALAFGGTVTTDASTIIVPSACPAPPAPPTVTVTKVSNGGVGAFGFTGSNGFAPQTITTAAPGVGVSGATQTLTAASVVTTVTESVPPAGFTLASITCSGLGAGGTATPDIATRTVTLNAAATSTGASIACTFTNTLAAPPPAPPTIVKTFNPTTINVNGVSTVTVTLNNPAATIGTLTSALVDNLPLGVVIAPTPNAGSTCGGAGAPIAVAGASTVTLPAGRTIPANGSCTLSVDVTSGAVALYVNTIPAGDLVTSNGNNAAPANANLTVIQMIVSSNPVPGPTLSEWGMILLTGLLAIAGFAALRRQGQML